jgi:UPF0755 protein
MLGRGVTSGKWNRRRAGALSGGLLLALVSFTACDTAPPTAEQPVEMTEVVIPTGATALEVGEALRSVGLVRYPRAFALTARVLGAEGSLKAGRYRFARDASWFRMLDQLERGSVEMLSLTIPEGFTAEQIAARVAEKTWLSEDTLRALMLEGGGRYDYPFLAANPTTSLEGYLFPKTYRIAEGASEDDVIRLLLEQFEFETSGIDLTYLHQRGLSNHDWVTLASMIEREVRVPDERVLVASVIDNRLQRGMHLEIDATIEYILPGTRPRLLNSHLQIDSPYNTYMYPGLPPGPIASPGLASLQAAAAPEETDYLYYVLTGEDGSHTFTETYDEFLAAKERSRDIVP